MIPTVEALFRKLKSYFTQFVSCIQSLDYCILFCYGLNGNKSRGISYGVDGILTQMLELTAALD